MEGGRGDSGFQAAGPGIFRGYFTVYEKYVTAENGRLMVWIYWIYMRWQAESRRFFRGCLLCEIYA